MSENEKIKTAIIEMTMSDYIGESLCADSIEIILKLLEKRLTIMVKQINLND